MTDKNKIAIEARENCNAPGGPAPRTRRCVMTSIGAVMAMGSLAYAPAGCAQGDDKRFRDRIRQRIGERGEVKLPTMPDDLPTDRIAAARAKPGPFDVLELDGVWTDPARGGRAVPWRAYLPKDKNAAPLAIFSHGGGGTRDSGRQYGEHLASHGLGSFHVQHVGSDRDAFRNDRQKIARAVNDPALAAVRFEDIGFVTRQFRESGGEQSTLINATVLGIYGHSFGAITTLVAAGQSLEGFGQQFSQREFKGAVALSPSPPRPGFGESETAFRDMLMPILHITGTEDHAPNGDFDAAARKIPFEQISNVDQFFVNLRGANHFTFGGNPKPQLGRMDFSYPGLARHHDLIKAAMLAFFQWTLAGDDEARGFLDRQYERLLGPGDEIVAKPAA